MPARKDTPAKGASARKTAKKGAAPLDPKNPFPAWTHTTEDCLLTYGVDASTGHSDARVKELQELFGKNELDKEEPTSIWEMLLEQFDDPLVKILLMAAMVSTFISYSEAEGNLAFHQFVEPVVILLILIINAGVGVWQENSAEQSLEALKRMQADTVRCLRNGEWVETLPAVEIVPGDIIHVMVGDKVPADARVLELRTTTLRAEQAALTGESVAVQKQVDAIDEADCPIQDKTNMLFAGTTISNGNCTAVIQSTGMGTEIGKIQETIQAAAEEEKEQKTPLKQKLDDFSDQLQWVIGIVCILVWAINLTNFLEWEMSSTPFVPDFTSFQFHYKKCIYYFQIAVALAVAAIPEGLPAVITTCLALGTRKMARRNAIVRKLPSVETLGCTTVICSDKTGTLTTNMMSIQRVLSVGSSASALKEFKVTGSTYDPDDGAVENRPKSLGMNIEALCQVCAVCNESKVAWDPEDSQYKHVGAPTEAALTVLVEKMGVPVEGQNEAIVAARKADRLNASLGSNKFYQDSCTPVATLEFSRDRKSMSVIARETGESTNTLFVKGAPESVLERCTHVLLENGEHEALTKANRARILKKVDEYAGLAYRCLGMAMNNDLGSIKGMAGLDTYDGPHHPAHKHLTEPSNFVKVEQDLTFIGLVAMQDPPRKVVKESIAACTTAGIRVMVITGDNQKTAEAICRDIGVLSENDDLSRKSFTGRDFSDLPRDQQKDLLSHGSMVFSRSEPKFKQDIVRLLQEMGEVVAMTGDGVNDAPALKAADIGVAMGIAGTEVAKESSDMVLADDNFSTIVAAVEEGRSIYQNMKAFIRYLISSNVGEVVSIFLTAALGLPEGLVPIHLLLVNLCTDGPPATALGFNPADPDVMRTPPRRADDKLINGWVFFRFMVIGLYVGFATVGIFVVWFMFPSFMGIPLDHDGHSVVTYAQLSNFHHCNATDNMFFGEDFSKQVTSYTTFAGDTVSVTGCDYFDGGKIKAMTLSLTVLVTIEMFNALNALSEDASLLVVPFWVNPYLLLAMVLSFGTHFVVLYVPAIARVFGVCPLDWNEWLLVLLFSAPVVLVDEVLKLVARCMNAKEREERLREIKKRL